MDDLDIRDDLRKATAEVERRLLDYEQSAASLVFKGEPLMELTAHVISLRTQLKSAERMASASLTHAMEALLAAHVTFKQVLSRETIDTILGALDTITDGLHDDNEPRQRIEAASFRVAAQLQALQQANEAKSKGPPPATANPPSAERTKPVLPRAPFEHTINRHAAGISPKIPVTDSVSIRLAKLPTDSRSRRILITEDEFVSRQLLLALLGNFGACDVAIDGREAVAAVVRALQERLPYNLICLDIMMPDMDGHQALESIRGAEAHAGLSALDRSKIVMTTALSDYENFHRAYEGSCDSYIVKPISKSVLLRQLRRLGIEPLI